MFEKVRLFFFLGCLLSNVYRHNVVVDVCTFLFWFYIFVTGILSVKKIGGMWDEL